MSTVAVTDEYLYKLLKADLAQIRHVLDELYRRGDDIAAILNPVREAQAALRERDRGRR